MTYSNAWDETQPQGTAAANTIDDIIRQLKVDIRERMNAIVNDWTDDPIVSRTSANRVLMLNASAAVIGPGVGTMSRPVSSLYVLSTDSLYVPVPVQSGWVVKKIEALVDRSSQANLFLTASARGFNTSPSSAVIGSIAVTSSGIQLATLFDNTTGYPFTNSETMDIYCAVAVAGSQWRFYGARISYDEV